MVQPTATKPSLILMYAQKVSPQQAITPHDALGTVTFEKEKGGSRDSDLEMMATATSTKVGDPKARDSDVEQLDYSPIGSRASVS